MQKSLIKELIERNFYRIPVAPRSTIIREWEKIEPTQIYELLQTCSPTVHVSAKELIQHMTTNSYSS